MTTQYQFYQRRATPRSGEEHPEDWPSWDLYAEPQNESAANPYDNIEYLAVSVETDLTPVVYGGGGIEWQDTNGAGFTTDDAEAQNLLRVIFENKS